MYERLKEHEAFKSGWTAQNARKNTEKEKQQMLKLVFIGRLVIEVKKRVWTWILCFPTDKHPLQQKTHSIFETF